MDHPHTPKDNATPPDGAPAPGAAESPARAQRIPPSADSVGASKPERPKLAGRFDGLNIDAIDEYESNQERLAQARRDKRKRNAAHTAKNGDQSGKTNKPDKKEKGSPRLTSVTVGGFLNGRFRLYQTALIRHLLGEGETSRQFTQKQLAKGLGLTSTAIQNYRDGSSLMSGATWSWLVGYCRPQLSEFTAPNIEARVVAGYCEAMAYLRDAMYRTGDAKERESDLPRPTPQEFWLLKTVLGKDWKLGLTRSSTGKAVDIILPIEEATALFRILQRSCPEDLNRAGISTAQALRDRLPKAIREWGVAYAGVVRAIALEWEKEPDRVH